MKRRWLSPALESCVYEFVLPGMEKGRPTLLLHGFPGENTRQNQDLAEHLAQQLKGPLYLLHYRGLGDAREGGFSFTGAVLEAERVLQTLFEQLGRAFDGVGHSFGGLVALNLYRRMPKMMDRLVLLSPLTEVPSEAVCTFVVKEAMAVAGVKFKQETLQGVMADIEVLRQNFEPARFVHELRERADQIHIIQATNDEEVPLQKTRDFVAELGALGSYTELNQGHRFQENREELFRAVVEKLHVST